MRLLGYSLVLFLVGSAFSLAPETKSIRNDLNSPIALAQKVPDTGCQNVDMRELDLLDLGGKKFNLFLYFRVKELLRKSQKDGLRFTITSSYRPCKEQVELRSANCPENDTQAESCSPPTEKPGDSLHNYGLAVDFGCDGYSVFESSPCYVWLKAHSSEFNLKQRPEEPWHWSLTGH